jgi:hypothetical protein
LLFEMALRVVGIFRWQVLRVFFNHLFRRAHLDLSTHLILLLLLALYSSLVSRCFVRVTYPIHLLTQSKAIEPSIHPITCVLFVWDGLASHRHLQIVGVVLSYWVGKLSHALLFRYMLLEILMAYFNINLIFTNWRHHTCPHVNSHAIRNIVRTIILWSIANH